MNTEFAQMVKNLAKPGEDILSSLDANKCDLLHMAIGVSGEAGELLDAVKKHVIYDKPLDVENCVEEIGDKLFYMQGLLNNLGITWEQVMEHNQRKLGKRYISGSYSNAQAKERADK